ncbi:MAG: pantetheine-phosphate adenylyltransferase [Nitrospiria bacterium]
MENREPSQIAVYPGTFDPITKGHIDIISRALRIFETVVIAVSPNPRKTPLFDLKERLDMIREATGHLRKLRIESFDGLLVHYLKKIGAVAIIRGIRAVSDFEYEFQMALMNRKLDLSVETVFLMPSKEYTYLSSSLIKEVAGFGGDVSDLVPEAVLKKLHERSLIKIP